MPSFRLSCARVPFGAPLALAALAIRGALGCGTEPCFRHSDCASSEICSSGSCILAPVDTPAIDGGQGDAITEGARGDTGTMPVADASDGATPVADASDGATPVADASDGATPVADASDGGTPVQRDASDAAADAPRDVGGEGDSLVRDAKAE